MKTTHVLTFFIYIPRLSLKKITKKSAAFDSETSIEPEEKTGLASRRKNNTVTLLASLLSMT